VKRAGPSFPVVVGAIAAAGMAILGNVAAEVLPESWQPYRWIAWPALVALLAVGVTIEVRRTHTGPDGDPPPEEPVPAPGSRRLRTVAWFGVAVLAVLAVVVAAIVAVPRGTTRHPPGIPVARTSTAPAPASGPFAYDETTGPGCDEVFRATGREPVARTAVDNSDDMSHAWTRGQSVEPHWYIPGCSDTMLYSQPSTSPDAEPERWQNSLVWMFSDVPKNVPCAFHIYIPDSPMSRYNATYDWTNGAVADDWIDANAFTIDQAAHVGMWYTAPAHTYTTGMAHLMLNDERGANPRSANAPLAASEVRLTCSA
jgi:hypothetical protein